jgi:general secretion pathway protein D
MGQTVKKFTLALILIFTVTVAGYIVPAKQSCCMLLAAPKNQKADPNKPQIRRFALNFKDVEINEFLNVMGQIIGKNILLDDRIKGKITISSAKKVPIDQAYNIMKSILELKGLAVIETGEILKVIPIQEAMKKNVEVIIDGKKSMISGYDERSITILLDLKKADAEEVANVLRNLKAKNVDIVVYRPMNTIIFNGTSSEIDGLLTIAKNLDKTVGEETKTDKSAGNIHVVHLENANAEDLAAVLSRVPFSESTIIDTSPIQQQRDVKPSQKAERVTGQQAPTGMQQPKGKLSIIANKETNSLIITAKPEEYKEILTIIKELDIVREQVLIEAMIIEVSIDSGWGLGIDWMYGYKMGDNILGAANLMSTALPSYKLPEGFNSTSKLPVPISQGFQLGYVNDKNVLGFALLNASASDSNFNILSTPQILTVDNHEAELNVGEEIGVPTNTRVSDQNTTFQTLEYKTVGLKMKLTPHITKKRRITLDLYQEVNSIIGDSIRLQGGTIIPPKLGKRDIKTKVTVNDGKTIVIGGLIKNEKNATVNKVPILGDIPLLGWLFKKKTVSHKKTNLLVFITPHIVTKQEKLDSITRQKREIQRRLQNQ